MKKLKTKGLIFLTILMLLFMALPVLAAGDGSGDGSGGGQDQPLSLTSSNPADGQKDVPVGVQIKLTFNKNVINMTVSDNNKKCFKLYSANNQLTPINVVMADDQIEPEKKREVLIVPAQALKAGTSYSLKIAPTLQAKSGATLGKEVNVSFTTAGSVNDDNKNTADNTKPQQDFTPADKGKDTNTGSTPAQTDTKESPDTTVSSVDKATPVDEPNDKNNDNKGEESFSTAAATDNKDTKGKFSTTAIAGLGALIIIGGLGYAYYRKRHK